MLVEMRDVSEWWEMCVEKQDQKRFKEGSPLKKEDPILRGSRFDLSRLKPKTGGLGTFGSPACLPTVANVEAIGAHHGLTASIHLPLALAHHDPKSHGDHHL